MKSAPSEKQLSFLSWEFGVFFHFGIRSFYIGHRDWDGRPMPASGFQPESLDCNQWIRVAREAGARYAILTTKHHDGFANWPSKYSDYSVAQTPWRDGKGDVVREFVDACRRYDMKVGLYYSPAQWGGAVPFDHPEEYDEYFINQITELLTEYGEIDYLWFDFNGSGGHQYDADRIVKTIRSLQPGIRLFGWDSEVAWVGNEDGYTPMPTAFSHRYGEGSRFLPVECDMMIRTTWFDCEANADRLKSVEELLGNWEYSVGRGGNLLLNIGPDRRGLLPDADAARLLEFGRALRARYGHPLPFGAAEPMEESGWWQIDTEEGFVEDLIGTELVDTVMIEEDITEGDAVRQFRIWCRPPISRGGSQKRPHGICVYCGQAIGRKAICRFPVFRTRHIEVEVVEAEGEAKLLSVKAFHVGSGDVPAAEW